MFCYGPDIAQLEAWWLSVKRAFQEKTITTDKEAVQIFHKAFYEAYKEPTKAVKSRLNGAMFVALIRSLLPKGIEEDTCESMYEIFQDMEWNFYLKLVHGLEFEEELRDCLCQLDEKIYYDIVKLIMTTCLEDEELEISRIPNPILGSVFIRYPTLKIPKKCYSIISNASLWLLVIKPDDFKDFCTYYSCFLDTASAFSEMLIKVIGDHLLERVGKNYQIGTVPKIKKLKPFTSAKHWIHMTRLFHNYICPHHWHNINRFSSKMSSIRFLMRCVLLFQIEIFHPMKKPKLMRVFRKQDKSFSNLLKNLEEEHKDIDDHLENLEDLLEMPKESQDSSVWFVQNFVSKHVVYSVMKRLLITCTTADENSKKESTIHFLNMCEQALLSPDVILQLYLEVCQGSELLKQPDFTQEITTFLNKATEAHTVEELVAPMVQLCLQSPKNVVYNIIHRALESKGHIPTLAKLLSEVSIICRYKEATQPSNLLVTCLKSFTKKASTMKQVENVTTLVQGLVKSSNEALDLSEFTSVVVVPLLRPDSNPLQTELACQLLHLVLDSTSVTLTCNVTILAVTLVRFANCSINSAELNKKDRFLSLFKKMESQLPESILPPELDWLKKQLKDFHPLLRIQAAELFHFSENDFTVQGINNLEKALLQSTCIKGDNPVSLAAKHLNSLSHSIRYAALVQALTKVLPVISQPDWVPVLQLVNLLLNDIFEQSQKPQDNDNTVLTLRATTDALVVHQKNSIPTNWNYVLSAYGQAIKHFSSKLESSEHLSYAFCEVCRLANELPPESNQYLLSSMLHLVSQALELPGDDKKLTLKVAINGINNELLKTSLQAKLENHVDK